MIEERCSKCVHATKLSTEYPCSVCVWSFQGRFDCFEEKE